MNVRADDETPRSQISRIPYLPGLDGLRAVAVVAVMIYHANHHWLSGGFLGVEVFFVISGYLITLLLIGERERTGTVDLKQFWLRRFRRLLPALFVMMAALAVYMALFERRPQGQTRGDFLAGIFYVSNWYQIVVGQGYSASEAFVPLRHLWSLAVEEQFYVLWPLVMVVVLRSGTRHLPRVAVKLALVSVGIAVLTAALFHSGDVAATCTPATREGYWTVFGRCISINDSLYLSTVTRAGGLMLGAAFAMVWRPAAIMRGPLRDRPHRLDAGALVGVLLLIVLVTSITISGSGSAFGIRFDPWLYRGGFLLTGIATVLVIAAATHQRSLTSALLGNPLFNWIGTRSYGLYLYHWPIYQIIREFSGVSLTVPELVLAMVVTVPITELSYRFVETPIRQGRLGEWWRTSRRGLTAPTALATGAVAMLLGVAVVSVATADDLCVGPTQCSIRDAAALQPGGTQPPTSEPATGPGDTTGSGGPTDTSGTPGTPGTPPVDTGTEVTTPVVTRGPYAIGESVMAGAARELMAGGFETVDTAEARQGSQIATILTQLRAGGQLGDTVLIQAGTNGIVSDEVWAEIMAQVPEELTPHVYVMTVFAPNNWIDENNQRIRALPATYPWVTVIDWAATAATITDQLCADATHIACPGSALETYTKLILDAVAAGRG